MRWPYHLLLCLNAVALQHCHLQPENCLSKILLLFWHAARACIGFVCTNTILYRDSWTTLHCLVTLASEVLFQRCCHSACFVVFLQTCYWYGDFSALILFFCKQFHFAQNAHLSSSLNSTKAKQIKCLLSWIQSFIANFFVFFSPVRVLLQLMRRWTFVNRLKGIWQVKFVHNRWMFVCSTWLSKAFVCF